MCVERLRDAKPDLGVFDERVPLYQIYMVKMIRKRLNSSKAADTSPNYYSFAQRFVCHSFNFAYYGRFY